MAYDVRRFSFCNRDRNLLYVNNKLHSFERGICLELIVLIISCSGYNAVGSFTDEIFRKVTRRMIFHSSGQLIHRELIAHMLVSIGYSVKNIILFW